MVTEDLLWPETNLQTDPPSQGVPFGHWIALGTCARDHPPAAAFRLALTMALCFWPLSSSSIHCPRPFLLSFPVPFPASSHPSSQSLSFSISPSVLPLPQEWGKTSTLSKTLQTAACPRKEEGTLSQQGLGASVWSQRSEVQRWGLDGMRRRLYIFALRFLTEESERAVRSNSVLDCGAQLSLWLPLTLAALITLWIPFPIPVPSGSTCVFRLTGAEVILFPHSLCRCDIGRDKTVLPLNEVRMSLTMEKVRGQILVCGKSGGPTYLQNSPYIPVIIILFYYLGAEVRHIETKLWNTGLKCKQHYHRKHWRDLDVTEGPGVSSEPTALDKNGMIFSSPVKALVWHSRKHRQDKWTGLYSAFFWWWDLGFYDNKTCLC